MEPVLLLCIFAVIAIQIWLIVLFVGMAHNIKSIKEKYLDSTPEAVNSFAAKRAALLGEQDQYYKRLINVLWARLENAAKELPANYNPEGQKRDDFNSEYYDELYKSIVSKIDAARQICAIIGRTLPEEMSSFEAFRAYLRSTSVS